MSNILLCKFPCWNDKKDSYENILAFSLNYDDHNMASEMSLARTCSENEKILSLYEKFCKKRDYNMDESCNFNMFTSGDTSYSTMDYKEIDANELNLKKDSTIYGYLLEDLGSITADDDWRDELVISTIKFPDGEYNEDEYEGSLIEYLGYDKEDEYACTRIVRIEIKVSELNYTLTK